MPGELTKLRAENTQLMSELQARGWVTMSGAMGVWIDRELCNLTWTCCVLSQYMRICSAQARADMHSVEQITSSHMYERKHPSGLHAYIRQTYLSHMIPVQLFLRCYVTWFLCKVFMQIHVCVYIYVCALVYYVCIYIGIHIIYICFLRCIVLVCV